MPKRPPSAVTPQWFSDTEVIPEALNNRDRAVQWYRNAVHVSTTFLDDCHVRQRSTGKCKERWSIESQPFLLPCRI
ncbi:MAG TPA: hypothetical protein VM493_08935, partial [Vicinamibacterales bacterium]|nr:hypothetical protein [Vicinamibacterales bacterium]